jgi:hypothetical protein
MAGKDEVPIRGLDFRMVNRTFILENEDRFLKGTNLNQLN